MRKLLAAVTLTATACAALPAFAATDADCQAMWTKADVNHDGVLSDAEAMRYAAAMRVRDVKMPSDGKLTQAVFMDACKADIYAPAKIDPGAPLKGANSFTEGQAKDRAVAHGALDVATDRRRTTTAYGAAWPSWTASPAKSPSTTRAMSFSSPRPNRIIIRIQS